MDKNSDAYRSREYDDFFEAAELDNLTEEETATTTATYPRPLSTSLKKNKCQ